MKKNANKQKKNGITVLKKMLKNDGRKLTWLSAVTEIQYQRLQRIVNQGYDPSITEASKIAAALRKSIIEVFPLEFQESVLYIDSERSPRSVHTQKGDSRRADRAPRNN